MTKHHDRWTREILENEEASEVRIGRHDNSILRTREFDDISIGYSRHSTILNVNGIMSAIAKERGDLRRNGRCRRGTSPLRNERQFALAYGFGGKVRRFLDISALEIGIRAQDFRLGHAVGDHVDHGRNRDAEIADARDACHARRVDRDAGERHRN